MLVILAGTLGAIWLQAVTGHWRGVLYGVLFAALIALVAVHGVLLYRAPGRRPGRPGTA